MDQTIINWLLAGFGALIEKIKEQAERNIKELKEHDEFS